MTMIDTPTNGNGQQAIVAAAKRPGGAGECKICRKYFRNLSLHETNSHGSGQEIIQCKNCGQEYKRVSQRHHHCPDAPVRKKAQQRRKSSSSVKTEEEVIAVLTLLLPTIPSSGLGMVSRWIASTTEMVDLLRKEK